MNTLIRVGLVLSLAFAVAGCGKKKEETTGEEKAAPAATAAASSSIVEVYERGQIAWNVDTNGQLLARVQDDSGTNTSKKASGTIEWNEGETVRSAKLSFDEKAEALVAQGPVPKDDLTEIRYSLVYDGEPVIGSLHVPQAGTAALSAEAEAAAKIDVSAAVPPHGGVIQVVGEDRVEIVADDDSDEVRVYVLDASWKPIVVGDRKITIAIGGAKPQVVVLTAGEGGAYFVGHWTIVGEPPRLTVMIKRPGATHVAIVGFHPGAKLHVAGGPKVKVKVKGVAWGPKADVKVVGAAPAAIVKVNGPKVKVDGPKADVKVNAGADAKIDGKGKVKLKFK